MFPKTSWYSFVRLGIRWVVPLLRLLAREVSLLQNKAGSKKNLTSPFEGVHEECLVSSLKLICRGSSLIGLNVNRPVNAFYRCHVFVRVAVAAFLGFDVEPNEADAILAEVFKFARGTSSKRFQEVRIGPNVGLALKRRLNATNASLGLRT